MAINKEHLEKERQGLLKDLGIAKQYIEKNMGLSLKEDVNLGSKTLKVALFICDAKLFKKTSKKDLSEATNWITKIFLHLQKVTTMQNPELLKNLKTRSTKH